MATFDLLVAIDLREGRVVRLRQGDFESETAYGSDPVAAAEEFVTGGARWLHVVDLDGARDGSPHHADVVRRIVGAVGDRARVEIAGGLRSEADVAAVLATGAARAVVGTGALEDAGFAERLVLEHGGDRIAVAIDVRDGHAVGRGWVAGTAGVRVQRAVADLASAGVQWFEVTAIDRDGTLAGPDLELLKIVRAATSARVIAAGGISSVTDIRAVREVGCAGVIVGRALYDGTLELETAIGAAASPGSAAAPGTATHATRLGYSEIDMG
ncbi:MAG: hisA [Chloroflexi bacterium]|nr:hisA [Chloroflexota bacterium]